MIVAVVAVAVMQTSIDEVIDMITMRDERMPAPVVIAGARHQRTVRGVVIADGDPVFVVMPVVFVMQMPVVQIVDVSIVQDTEMPAGSAVNVGVIAVGGVVAHEDRLAFRRVKRHLF